jgi:hypothetical protein
MVGLFGPGILIPSHLYTGSIVFRKSICPDFECSDFRSPLYRKHLPLECYAFNLPLRAVYLLAKVKHYSPSFDCCCGSDSGGRDALGILHPSSPSPKLDYFELGTNGSFVVDPQSLIPGYATVNFQVFSIK